jgi:PqqD family protein of HPr-rel-A system
MSSSQADSVKWLVDKGIGWAWVCWEQDVVIYNANSGETHLLNRLAFEALKLLNQKSLNIDELSKGLEQKFEGLDLGELKSQLSDLLAAFQKLGFVLAQQP